MTKFLLAIVLLLSTGRLVTGPCAYSDTMDFCKHTEQDEDSKNESSEKGQPQFNNDDKLFHHYVQYLAVWYTLISSSKVCLQQDEYIDFVERPCTPPPDVRRMNL